MPSEAFGVFDCPPSVVELPRPREQPPVSTRLASIRTDATVRFVCGSIAVAVWVLLCGSTPMITIATMPFPFFRWIV